jgi:hypothetical protein|nr:MAG TPA_asm: Putative tail length tape measure protein [Caudoviricetes sp.]
MAKDNNVNIKIKADSKEAESGIDKVTSSLNSFGKKSRQSLAFLNNLNGSLSFAGKAFTLVSSSIKKAAATIKDLNDTALVQIKAEKQLEAAAKNNPFLNAQNVKQLKNFASELQNIGTIGDEELLPLMAQLASAGRTQAEIQEIMSAALDVSASGAMSMESAVRNLNKTFSGLSGELGESIPQIKSLTKEQLQNGEAVKIIAKQYAGMAAETAKATGSGVQLSNAIGDLKEQLGMGFAAIIAPIQRLFTNLVTKVTQAIGLVNEFLGFSTEVDIKPSDAAFRDWQNLKKEVGALSDEIAASEKLVESSAKETGTLIKNEKELADVQQRIEELKAKGNDKTKEERTELTHLIKAKREYIKSQKEEADYNVDLSEAEAKRSEANGELEDKKAKLAELTEKCAEAEKKYNELLKEEQKTVEKTEKPKDYKTEKELVLKWGSESLTEIEKMRNELATIELLKEQISSGEIDIGVNISQVDTAIENLKKSLSEKNFQKVVSNVTNVLGTLSSGLNNISTYFNSAMESRLSDVQEEAEAETDSLKMQYEEGLISYDEYCDKKNELDKKAAQREYKIKLAQWQMDLAMANVSAAQAVANALASGTPPANILNAVAAGLLGAAQVATVAENKPSAPSFSTGGFLTGNSTHGDKIPFKGNAGEAVLNPAEQRNFMRLANGEGTQAPVTVNMPITIENNAANEVSVSASSDYERVRITVDKIVNSSLRSGAYNESLMAANSSMKGAKYL